MNNSTYSSLFLLIIHWPTLKLIFITIIWFLLQTIACRSTKIFGFADIFKKQAVVPVETKVNTATIEFLPSKIIATAAIGEKLSDVAKNANVEIKYKCKKGECGTCEVNIGGKWVKACQTTITSSDAMQITIREVVKKKPAFFSPQSLADGFNNNVLGMVGLVSEGAKVDGEYEARMVREKKLADLVAAKKAAREAEK